MKSASQKILRWGFTLLEVLIALVIMAVLAGLAFPAYSTNVERARASEAVRYLIATRGSMVRYYAENGTYAGAALNRLDFDPNLAAGGSIPLFSYNFVAAPGANTYSIRARRNAGGACAVSPYSVFIDQSGTITYS